MSALLFGLGIALACFVGFNIGGGVSVGALTIDEESPTVGELEPARDGREQPAIGEEGRTAVPEAAALFDPGTTLRVVGMQNLVPIAATVGSFLTFSYVLTP